MGVGDNEGVGLLVELPSTSAEGSPEGMLQWPVDWVLPCYKQAKISCIARYWDYKAEYQLDL